MAYEFIEPDDDFLDAMYACPNCLVSYHPDFLFWSTDGTIHDWRCGQCLDNGYGGWRTAHPGYPKDALEDRTYYDFLDDKGRLTLS